MERGLKESSDSASVGRGVLLPGGVVIGASFVASVLLAVSVLPGEWKVLVAYPRLAASNLTRGQYSDALAELSFMAVLASSCAIAMFHRKGSVRDVRFF